MTYELARRNQVKMIQYANAEIICIFWFTHKTEMDLNGSPERLQACCKTCDWSEERQCGWEVLGRAVLFASSGVGRDYSRPKAMFYKMS